MHSSPMFCGVFFTIPGDDTRRPRQEQRPDGNRVFLVKPTLDIFAYLQDIGYTWAAMQSIKDQENWNLIIATLPDAHLLQTKQWAQVKSKVSWRPVFCFWGQPSQPDAAAQILLRTITLRGFSANLKVVYIPKGPLLRDWGDVDLRNRVLDDLIGFARKNGAIFLKIDPDIPLGQDIPEGVDDPMGTAIVDELIVRGFHYSKDQIQFRNTVLLDLSLPEDELLARMKQKTRYNIRLASRKGVTVRKGSNSDLGMLYRMYAETSLRDGFAIRGEVYYQNVWQTFMAQDEPGCIPLIAEVDDEPVAALMLFHFGDKAYYLHGMSRSIYRNKMPTYLLQWEAMKTAKNLGCTIYDLWGAPEVFDESDSMWGVFRFKSGLGGEVFRTIGAYDLPLRPFYYNIYSEALPWVLNLMRRRGRAHTREFIGE